MLEFKLLESIFDIVRIVDPMNKVKVNTRSASQLYSLPYCNCFEMWKNGEPCKNCISLQAISSKTTQVKFEVVSARRYMVIAAPYKTDEKDCVIELVMDITDNHFFDNLNSVNDTMYGEVIEHLNKAIVTDELTQVYNRRYIEEVLPYKYSQLKYSDSDMGILLLDIDHFKSINDRYGHLTGDKVIEKVASVIDHEVRGDLDWVARYGGEEFIIVLESASHRTFLSICERLRKKIEDEHIIVNTDKIDVTVSIGGVLVDRNCQEALDKILEYTDALLYKAKANGRNCVMIGRSMDIKNE